MVQGGFGLSSRGTTTQKDKTTLDTNDTTLDTNAIQVCSVYLLTYVYILVLL